MNFRSVRKKIKTISNVKKITKAMQMVSAVKMKKSQEKAVNGKLYRESLFDIVDEIIASGNSIDLPISKINQTKKSLAIVITSNKGLCGSFNANIIRFVDKDVDYQTTDFLIVGKKGMQFLTKIKANIIADFTNEDATSIASSIFTFVEEKYLSGLYGNVALYYNNFISTSKYNPNKLSLLPFLISPKTTFGENRVINPHLLDYHVEPSPESVLPQLVHDVLIEKIRMAIYDSQASEHSARMLSMKQATDSAGEIVGSLTLLRNKLRQTAITNELLDMIAATL